MQRLRQPFTRIAAFGNPESRVHQAPVEQPRQRLGVCVLLRSSCRCSSNSKLGLFENQRLGASLLIARGILVSSKSEFSGLCFT